MTATYHLAPRFSLKPPPDGPLHLGTIVDDLVHLEPLNENCRLAVPCKVYDHRSSGFAATRSEMKAGKYGVWAKFVGMSDIGGKFSGAPGRTADEIYRFEHLDEIYFTATQDYMKKSMNQTFVKEFVEGSGYASVYMITGLKIARNPAVGAKRCQKHDINFELGFNQPGGTQGLALGLKIKDSKDVRQAITFEKADDFIYGIRVKRLYFKKGLFSRKPGKFVGEHFHRGATLVDNDAAREENAQDEVEEIEIDANDEEMSGKEIMADRDMGVGGGGNWVVPHY